MWRCAIRRANAAADADTPSEDNADDDDKHGANEKSPLLVPAGADTDPAGQPSADPAAQPDASNQEQPQSLYLFLAGHAFK